MVQRTGFLAALCVCAFSVSAFGLPTNGDFSAGLSGWTVSGVVMDGGGFAVFAEAGGPAASSIYQDVVIGPNDDRLTFEYTLITFGTFNHLALPDAFTARLLDPLTLAPLIATSGRGDYVYEDARGASDSIVTHPLLVDRRPSPDPARSGWFAVTLDISSLAPGVTARVEFDLFGGANGQQTYAALDNVSLYSVPTGAIPEPLSMTLTSVALAAVGRYARRRRSA